MEEGLRDCDELAATVLDVLEEEYEGAESEPHHSRVGDETVAVGYEVHFICLDLVVKAVVRAFHWRGRTVLITTQAESREYDQLAEVFRAVETSLVEGGPAEAGDEGDADG